MNVSAKTEYACTAVLELASAFGSGELLQVRKIAESHAIPSKFLVQILLQLKAAGVVNSARGACGDIAWLVIQVRSPFGTSSRSSKVYRGRGRR